MPVEVVPVFVDFWGGGPSPESCRLVGLRVSDQEHLEKGVRDRHEEDRTYCSPG